jgi:hypothetical protein
MFTIISLYLRITRKYNKKVSHTIPIAWEDKKEKKEKKKKGKRKEKREKKGGEKLKKYEIEGGIRTRHLKNQNHCANLIAI